MSPDKNGNGAGRIGYVVKRYPRFSETFIVNEILAHEAAGLEVEIFALRPPNDTHFQNQVSRVRAAVNYLPSQGVKAVDFWKALEATSRELPKMWCELDAARGEEMVDVYQAVLLARAIREKGITHLHAHFATSATSIARLAARLAGISYTFTAHAKDIFHESVDAANLRRKLSEAASIITVSDFNLEFLRETYGESASNVERVYNGLDLAEFPYEEPANRPPRIVSVGRLVEKKGFADLIDACAILAERGCRFECLIVGTGELETELNEQIEHLGAGSFVKLLGPRPQTEIIGLVQSAAVFAAPCVVGMDGNRDGLPTVLLEAMSLGTPCVSTDVTGIPEVLRHKKTGLMVAQHAPHELADALETLLTDGNLRVRLARQARALIEDNFDICQNTALLRETFARAVRVLSVVFAFIADFSFLPEAL